MIKKNNPLSIVRQCRLLDLCRSAVYFRPAEPSEEEPEIKRLIGMALT
jgi:hypothetical protein